MTSFPPRPAMTSLPPRPAMTSYPFVPWRRSLPEVPTIVAGRPSHVTAARRPPWGIGGDDGRTAVADAQEPATRGHTTRPTSNRGTDMVSPYPCNVVFETERSGSPGLEVLAGRDALDLAALLGVVAEQGADV